MSTELGHYDLKLLLGAFVLDAVNADERHRIERHILGCLPCRREVIEHRKVVAAMGPPAIAPPPEVWERIAAAIQAAST